MVQDVTRIRRHPRSTPRSRSTANLYDVKTARLNRFRPRHRGRPPRRLTAIARAPQTRLHRRPATRRSPLAFRPPNAPCSAGHVTTIDFCLRHRLQSYDFALTDAGLPHAAGSNQTGDSRWPMAP